MVFVLCGSGRVKWTEKWLDRQRGELCWVIAWFTHWVTGKHQLTLTECPCTCSSINIHSRQTHLHARYAVYGNTCLKNIQNNKSQCSLSLHHFQQLLKLYFISHYPDVSYNFWNRCHYCIIPILLEMKGIPTLRGLPYFIKSARFSLRFQARFLCSWCVPHNRWRWPTSLWVQY